MTTYTWFDRGIVAALMHLILGAIFGAVMFAVVTIWFVDSILFWRLIIFGAVSSAAAATIWRSRYLAFVANNPLFLAWRRIFGSSF